MAGTRESSSRERGVVDRGGSGNIHGGTTSFDREVIAGDGVTEFRCSDVGVEVKELDARIASWIGRGNKV